MLVDWFDELVNDMDGVLLRELINCWIVMRWCGDGCVCNELVFCVGVCVLWCFVFGYLFDLLEMIDVIVDCV